ncbi:ATP-binding protein [Actomonas aquatica]|uniref:histidine kinase n=1 Tax=Actomonas aquatica TaxID=2866162 RepID=A0ABZ1C3P0_9BACT|nr:ATP-binding protein [Opitutus sp. WL0086]WRQ85982.1 tetratricopeptide repeat-containing sensor histidine kinase [Opitutus sp. WL0086]
MNDAVKVSLGCLAMCALGGSWAGATVEEAEAQYEQVKVYYQDDNYEAMAAAAQAGLAALGEGDDELKLRGSLWYWSGVAQQMLGDYDAALDHYATAITVHDAAGNLRQVAAVLNSYAGVLGERGRQTERLQALVRAHGIFEELGEPLGRAALAHSIGHYYAEQDEFVEAQGYYEQSIAIRREMDNPAFLADGLMGLGINLRELTRIDEARAALDEALAIHREAQDEGGLAGVLTNLGNLERDQKNYEAALSAYTEALGYDRAAGYRFGVSILTHNLALTHHEMGNDTNALEWADIAVDVADELRLPERQEYAYQLRADIREALGDGTGALADTRRVMEIRDERGAASREQALLDLQTEFETAQKQHEIDRLERANVERELALTREAAAREAAEQAQAVEQARGRTTLVLAIAAGAIAAVLAGLFRVSRRSERRLAKQREEIEHAVAGLRDAHGELKKLYDRKSAFLGFAVHDLRSPLYAIDAVCGEIESGLLDSPVQGVGEIRDAARRMRDDLDAWLEAERKEQTEIAVHPVSSDLAQLATDVVALNQPAARAKGIALELVAPVAAPVRVDPWRMREVIDNLVSNALKYSPRDSGVQVTVVVEGGRAVARVIDAGPGLSAEDHEKVFGAYARLSAQPTGGESSTGLGLHLCKRIIDAHEGSTLAVENVPTGGAIFTVSVPVAK